MRICCNVYVLLIEYWSICCWREYVMLEMGNGFGIFELLLYMEGICASMIDGIEMRWWLYVIVMYRERMIIKWKFDCPLLYLLIKFDEYWDESNPRAENSAKEKKILWLRIQQMWPRIRQEKKKCGWEFNKFRGLRIW